MEAGVVGFPVAQQPPLVITRPQATRGLGNMHVGASVVNGPQAIGPRRRQAGHSAPDSNRANEISTRRGMRVPAASGTVCFAEMNSASEVAWAASRRNEFRSGRHKIMSEQHGPDRLHDHIGARLRHPAGTARQSRGLRMPRRPVEGEMRLPLPVRVPASARLPAPARNSWFAHRHAARSAHQCAFLTETMSCEPGAMPA